MRPRNLTAAVAVAVCLASTACTTHIKTPDAQQPTVAHQPAPLLQRFTVENTLVGWTGYGLRDRQGNVVVPIQNHELTALPNGGWLEQGFHSSGRILDAHGKPVSQRFHYIEQVDPGLDTLLIGSEGSPILGGKGGLVRDDGTVVAPLQYRKLKHLRHSPGLFSFIKYRRYGVLDAQGQVVLKPQWDDVKGLNGLIRVSKYGKQAVYDRHGKRLVPLQADVRYRAIDDSPWISRCKPDPDTHDTSCQILDDSLQPAIEGRFQSAKYLPDAKRLLLKLPDDQGFALYDDAGKRIAKLDIKRASGTADGGYLIVGQADPDNHYNTLAGLVDRNGQWVRKPGDGDIDKLRVAFSEREASKGKPPQFTIRTRTDDGDYLDSVIDAHGKTILPAKPWNIRSYYPSLGLYLVNMPDNRIGVVDANGHWRIKPFKGHPARNSTLPLPYLMLTDDNDHYILYNLATGQPVFDKSYEYLDVETSYWPLSGPAPWPEFVVVNAKRDGKYGVIDLNGNVIVPFKYKNIEALDRWGRERATTTDGHETHVNALGKKRSRQLHQRVAKYLGSHPAPIAAPDMPYAGRYVPAAYRSQTAVQAAYQQGKLAWPAAPTILVNSRYTALDLNMVVDPKRPYIDFIEYYCPRENGFDVLMPGAGLSRKACVTASAPRLILKPGDGNRWHCDNCSDYGLPADWVRLPNTPAATGTPHAPTPKA